MTLTKTDTLRNHNRSGRDLQHTIMEAVPGVPHLKSDQSKSAEAKRLQTFLKYNTPCAAGGALLVLTLAAVFQGFGLFITGACSCRECCTVVLGLAANDTEQRPEGGYGYLHRNMGNIDLHCISLTHNLRLFPSTGRVLSHCRDSLRW